MAKKTPNGERRAWRIDFWKAVDVGAVAVIVMVAAAWLLLDDHPTDVGGNAPRSMQGGNAELSAIPAPPKGASRVAAVAISPDS